MTLSLRVGFGRGRLNGFVKTHALAWELTMAVLTLAYVALSFISDENGNGVATVALAALAVIFLFEFGARFWDAESRIAYLRGHWIDLLTCLPPIGPLRALRLLRLIGLLRLAQEVRDVAHTTVVARSGADSSATWIVWPTALLVWVGAAEGFWLFERGHNPAVNNFGDALYLAFMTVTTVGYGDLRPVTPEGKILAGALVFVGLGLLGFISAQMTARWLRTERGENRLEQRMAILSNDVAEIKQLLHRISDGAALSEPAGKPSGIDRPPEI